MAEYFTFSKILQVGGPTIVILILSFIVAIILMVERTIYFLKNQTDSDALLLGLSEKLQATGVAGAREYLAGDGRPEASVLLECLESQGNSHRGAPLSFHNDDYEEAKSRRIGQVMPGMEKYSGVFATLAGVSPFIGLLGTVLGIIRAFVSLGTAAPETTAGLSGLNAGVAEALVTTAAGLFVAIPSTIAYNVIRIHVNRLILQMEISASRLKSMLKKELLQNPSRTGGKAEQ